MTEKIERRVGRVKIEVLLCICEREECGWAWVVSCSRGVPKSCSHCKGRNWNGRRETAVRHTKGDPVARSEEAEEPPATEVPSAEPKGRRAAAEVKRDAKGRCPHGLMS